MNTYQGCRTGISHIPDLPANNMTTNLNGQSSKTALYDIMALSKLTEAPWFPLTNIL